jgi:uncharacterized glyoxalase superfamily protein PhnB
MPSPAKTTRASLIAALRYSDADAALALLTDVFGFEEHTVFRDDAGKVAHAELTFGNGMVMIGPVADTPFGKFMARPREAGGVTTSLYGIVTDPDAHYARAKAAGLEVVMPLRDESYGGREYSVRDPEGHIWTFGTYDPFAPPKA